MKSDKYLKLFEQYAAYRETANDDLMDALNAPDYETKIAKIQQLHEKNQREHVEMNAIFQQINDDNQREYEETMARKQVQIENDSRRYKKIRLWINICGIVFLLVIIGLLIAKFVLANL